MGYFLALTAVFFWSFNIIIANYFATSLAPFEIAFGRWLIAALILLPMAWNNIRQNFTLLLKNWKLVIGLAATGIVLDNTLVYYAGRTASAIDMGLLIITGPIFLLILARIFLKTYIGLRQLCGLAIAVVGVSIIILQGNITRLNQIHLAGGDLIMLVNTLCFAIYSLLQTKRPTAISQTAMLAVSAWVGVLIITPFLFTPSTATAIKHLTTIDFVVFLYLGIFNSVLSYLAWNTALSEIGTFKTSLIYYLMPLFSGLEAYIMLHEKLYWSQFAGGALIIGGIILASITAQTKSKPRRG